jgi:class 3 adenylate cyclase
MIQRRAAPADIKTRIGNYTPRATGITANLKNQGKDEHISLPPERRMEFRIGVNLGDVMVEGEQIFGDGVNVAARHESLAEPGGICISGKGP